MGIAESLFGSVIKMAPKAHPSIQPDGDINDYWREQRLVERCLFLPVRTFAVLCMKNAYAVMKLSCDRNRCTRFC